MSSQQPLRRASGFGADDRPTCPQCGRTMHVIRRTPDAAAGDGYELQTLACNDCNHQVQHVVDRDGNAPS